MARSFRSFRLSGDDIGLALPLVRATWPEIDLRRWEAYVHSFDSLSPADEGAVICLSDLHGTICGLFAYRVVPDLHHGVALHVELFTAADLANSREVVASLIDAAEAAARHRHCPYLSITLQPRQDTLLLHFYKSGYAVGSSLGKQVVAVPAN